MQFEEYVEVASPAEQALGYLADFNNLPEWEPTVWQVEQIRGKGACEGAEFDVEMRFAGQALSARYICTNLRPSEVRFRAEGKDFIGSDQIHVLPRNQGAAITYFAEINPQGVIGKLCTPLSFLVMEWNNTRLLRNIRRRLDAPPHQRARAGPRMPGE